MALILSPATAKQPIDAVLRPEWAASAALVSMPAVRPVVVANQAVTYPPGKTLTPALSPQASITGVGVLKASGSFGILRASGSFESGVEIPSGGDWTFMVLFTPSGYTGTNPGIWRNDTTSSGSTFVIYEASTRLWVRQNGSNYYGTSARPAVGKQTSIVVSVNSGSRIRAFVNGVNELDSSVVATADMTGTNGIFKYGIQSLETINGNFELFGFWNSARYSDSELISLGRNPYGTLFKPRQIIIPVSAGAGGGTALAPTAGHAVAAGYTPGIGQPKTLAPAKASAVALGYTPSVSQAQTVAPAKASAVATGSAPSIGQPKTLAPAKASGVVAGRAPSVSQPVGLSPAKGAAVVTGKTPAIGQPKTLAPAAGHAVATGRTPTVDQPVGLSPSKAAIVVTGKAPTIGQPKTIAPGVCHAVAGGYAPVISQFVAIAPAKGAIIVLGRAPSIGQPKTLAPVKGAAVVAGKVPAISQSAETVPVRGGGIVFKGRPGMGSVQRPGTGSVQRVRQ